MKERNISLENDLMMLGQEPMDEPDSSTTIELQRVVKETERKMLKPPAPHGSVKGSRPLTGPVAKYLPTNIEG